ncbi:MAG: hypothetical protein QGH40_01095, partial [bacterium]|nr:hypothetical protein [bacterium]
MRTITVLLIAALVLTLIPSPASSRSLIGNFGQFKKDLFLLQAGVGAGKAYMAEYKGEIKEAKEIRELYVSESIFSRLRAGLKGASLLDSKRGRRMISEGISLYQNIDPPLKRVLDTIGSRDADGRISERQIHRAAKGAGIYEVFSQWKKRPFSFFFRPRDVAAAYRSGYNTTQESLQQYRELSEFLDGDTEAARIIRAFANITTIDWDDKKAVENLPFKKIRNDLPRNDFDP